MKLIDKEHGRTWRMETDRAAVGFRYKVFIEPFPEPVGFGWSEGDEDEARHILVAQMATMSATPEPEVVAPPTRKAHKPPPKAPENGVAVPWCHECDTHVPEGRTCPECGVFLGMKLIEPGPGLNVMECPQCGARVSKTLVTDNTLWCPACMGEVELSGSEPEGLEPEDEH